jgi:hypothetical protein
MMTTAAIFFSRGSATLVEGIREREMAGYGRER